MNFNKHFELKDKHSFLSPSKYHWVNYDHDKLISTFSNFLAIRRGTELHDFAAQCIRLKVRLPKSKKTLNAYVNDAIGFRMTPEQPLYFSSNCFGTADAISFDNKRLRISDLKTGAATASIIQLEVYAALFCLEYGVDPKSIEIELRLYQNDEIIFEVPDPLVIKEIMEKIMDFDKILDSIKEESEAP